MDCVLTVIKEYDLVFDNELEQVKIAKVNNLRSLGINPYPHFLNKGMSIAKFKEEFLYIKDLDVKSSDKIVTLCGRIKLKRVSLYNLEKALKERK